MNLFLVLMVMSLSFFDVSASNEPSNQVIEKKDEFASLRSVKKDYLRYLVFELVKNKSIKSVDEYEKAVNEKNSIHFNNLTELERNYLNSLGDELVNYFINTDNTEKIKCANDFLREHKATISNQHNINKYMENNHKILSFLIEERPFIMGSSDRKKDLIEKNLKNKIFVNQVIKTTDEVDGNVIRRKKVCLEELRKNIKNQQKQKKIMHLNNFIITHNLDSVES